jgi:hypothetical protein
MVSAVQVSSYKSKVSYALSSRQLGIFWGVKSYGSLNNQCFVQKVLWTCVNTNLKS